MGSRADLPVVPSTSSAMEDRSDPAAFSPLHKVSLPFAPTRRIE